jgi:hypothetical protein
MNKKWAILKSNYVVDVIMWDGVTPYTHPFPYDTMVEDIEYTVGLGDWYEELENTFYRPLSTPPDFPPQL